MDHFFEITCSPMVWVFSVLELALGVFLLTRYLKDKKRLTLFTMIITFGLFYDAFMIALGVFVDPAKVSFLQQIRYYLHVILIPLLMIITADILKCKKVGTMIFHSIAAVLIVVGFISCIQSVYKPEFLGGLSRLVLDKENTPSWVSIYTIMVSVIPVIPLIVAGIITWIKEKTPFVFLSGFLMFVFAAAVTGPYAFYATMYGELFMVGFLTLYTIKRR